LSLSVLSVVCRSILSPARLASLPSVFPFLCHSYPWLCGLFFRTLIFLSLFPPGSLLTLHLSATFVKWLPVFFRPSQCIAPVFVMIPLFVGHTFLFLSPFPPLGHSTWPHPHPFVLPSLTKLYSTPVLLPHLSDRLPLRHPLSFCRPFPAPLTHSDQQASFSG